MPTKFHIFLKTFLYFMDQPKTKKFKFFLNSCTNLALSIKESASLYFLYFRINFSIFNQPLCFILRKISISFTIIFSLFVFIFFWKILIPFMGLFLKPFFVFFYNIQLTFIIYRKKNYKKMLYWFFSML